MELIDRIDKEKLPEHVAIIMDGNGRWAKSKGKPRIFGHKNGVTAVREISEIAAEIGIKYLTLYAFSTENWNRPQLEVNALMSLLVETIKLEINTLNTNNIRLNAIGDITQLPRKSHKALLSAIDSTKSNTRMTMNLALNYSARWDILNAVKDIANQVRTGEINSSDINEESFSSFLTTADMPDPELLIRTSGETRISNFLLWEIAYAELYFTKTYWPDFSKNDFLQAVIDFQHRERRFGKTSEQVRE